MMGRRSIFNLTRCFLLTSTIKQAPPLAGRPPPRESGLLKRTAEVSNISDHDESFPEKAHSVAVDLGMLSLNADSSQNHYLGSSSGLLFANLIGASPKARDAPSAHETSSQSFMLEDEPLIEPDRRSFALHYRALHQLLRQARANAVWLYV